MKQDLKCFLNSHKYEIYKEEDIKFSGTDIVVAKTIISRCSNCGKLHAETITLTNFSY